jgi:hypothetical protein
MLLLKIYQSSNLNVSNIDISSLCIDTPKVSNNQDYAGTESIPIRFAGDLILE